MRRSASFRILARVAVWLFATAASLASAETLTLATYNLQNYGPADRMTESGFRPNYPKPESEKQALRRVIRALNADVLVVQEMGLEAYLEELRRDLRAEGCDYPHIVLATAADPDRHVALLSRHPLVTAKTHDALTFPYFGGREAVKRGLLEAVIHTSAGDLTIFAVHLKSRFTDRADDVQSGARRVGEATAIRDAVLSRFPDPTHARFVILGDCNDSPTSKALERLQHRGQTAIATLVPVGDPKGETWTYCYRKEDVYSRVDHILVSPPLRATVVGGKAAITDISEVSIASDHRPVVVRLDLK